MNKIEALAALAAGKKVRCPAWKNIAYLFVSNTGRIMEARQSEAGHMEVAPAEWNEYSINRWQVVIEEKVLLQQAFDAAEELQRNYVVLANSNAFSQMMDYLKSREFMLQLGADEVQP